MMQGKENFDFINGEVLLINKPYRWTSFDVVCKIRNAIIKFEVQSLKFKVKEQKIKESEIKEQIKKAERIKIGHAGTLDPLATGLLIICTGKNTKKIDEFQNLEKEYTGEITIGASTVSGDLEHEISKTYDISNVSNEHIYEAAKKFTGEIQQKAPAYSAKKIKGIRAYEYARKGEDVDIKSNTVCIKEFEIVRIELPKVFFRIRCTKGTYIRSIAIDFGEALNSGAHLSSLCRTKIGDYKLEDSYEVGDFINLLNLQD
jgi:tRNA pseudouridine55 synthase